MKRDMCFTVWDVCLMFVVYLLC